MALLLLATLVATGPARSYASWTRLPSPSISRKPLRQSSSRRRWRRCPTPPSCLLWKCRSSKGHWQSTSLRPPPTEYGKFLFGSTFSLLLANRGLLQLTHIGNKKCPHTIRCSQNMHLYPLYDMDKPIRIKPICPLMEKFNWWLPSAGCSCNCQVLRYSGAAISESILQCKTSYANACVSLKVTMGKEIQDIMTFGLIHNVMIPGMASGAPRTWSWRLVPNWGRERWPLPTLPTGLRKNLTRSFRLEVEFCLVLNSV